MKVPERSLLKYGMLRLGVTASQISPDLFNGHLSPAFPIFPADRAAKCWKKGRERKSSASREDVFTCPVLIIQSCDIPVTLAPAIRLRYSWCLMLKLAESVSEILRLQTVCRNCSSACVSESWTLWKRSGLFGSSSSLPCRKWASKSYGVSLVPTVPLTCDILASRIPWPHWTISLDPSLDFSQVHWLELHLTASPHVLVGDDQWSLQA